MYWYLRSCCIGQNVLGGGTDVEPNVVVSESEVAVEVIVRDMSSEILESVVDVLLDRVVGRILVISVNMIRSQKFE